MAIALRCRTPLTGFACGGKGVITAAMAGRSNSHSGIDPGLRRTGWGVIDVAGNRLIFMACGSVADQRQGRARRAAGDDP